MSGTTSVIKLQCYVITTLDNIQHALPIIPEHPPGGSRINLLFDMWDHGSEKGPSAYFFKFSNYFIFK